RTAAGWGWSTGAMPDAGRMDLLTVVTHELGHVLGLAPTATGVMETTLAPGVRQLPEPAHGEGTTALPSTTVVQSSLPGASTGVVTNSSFSLSPIMSFEHFSGAVVGIGTPGQVGPVFVNRQPVLPAPALVEFSSRATGTVPSPAKRPEYANGFGEF